jgi:hypothetical protein
VEVTFTGLNQVRRRLYSYFCALNLINCRVTGSDKYYSRALRGLSVLVLVLMLMLVLLLLFLLLLLLVLVLVLMLVLRLRTQAGTATVTITVAAAGPALSKFRGRPLVYYLTIQNLKPMF